MNNLDRYHAKLMQRTPSQRQAPARIKTSQATASYQKATCLSFHNQNTLFLGLAHHCAVRRVLLILNLFLRIAPMDPGTICKYIY